MASAGSRRDQAVERTPDGRYLIVRGRLWRASNPALPEAVRARWVGELMAARRAVAAGLKTNDAAAVRRARDRVQTAKVELGERGAVWWTDGAPDYSRRLVENTPYGVAGPASRPRSSTSRT